MTQEDVNNVLQKLCLEFGNDFRASTHEENDTDDTPERTFPTRIVVLDSNGRFRPITIPLVDWVANYDKCLEEFRPVYKYMMGESEDGK